MNLVCYLPGASTILPGASTYPARGLEPRLIDGFILLLVSRFGIKRSSFLTPV
jgi:hypothetical protein